MEDSVITTQDLFVYERAGFDENHKVIGKFRPTGIRPKVAERLEAHGIRFSVDTFAYDPRGGGRR